MGEDKFKNRAKFLLFFLLIWAVIMTVRLFYYTVYAREKYCDYGSKLAWREGTIKSARGKILSSDKRVLAWSEKHFALTINDLSEKSYNANLKKRLGEILGEYKIKKLDEFYSVNESLSPHQIEQLSEVSKSYRSIKIVPFFKRIIFNNKKVKAFIGNIKLSDGREIGISGIEQKFNKKLTGKDGCYKVMLDRNREWIPKTWSLVSKVEMGQDVTLNLTLKDIIDKSERIDEHSR